MPARHQQELFVHHSRFLGHLELNLRLHTLNRLPDSKKFLPTPPRHHHHKRVHQLPLRQLVNRRLWEDEDPRRHLDTRVRHLLNPQHVTQAAPLRVNQILIDL